MMRLKLILAILVCISSVAAAQDTESGISQRILERYAGMGMLTMTARLEDGGGRVVYSVNHDGAYSYVQFSKQLYKNIYREHRDIENEWESYPAFFSYYDGGVELLSSASFDPTGMYETHVLNEPLVVGSPIQVKGCIWPVLPLLFKEGVFETNSDGLVNLFIESISTTILFDSDGLLQEVVWGDTGALNGYIGRWKYDEYVLGNSGFMPRKMTYSLGQIIEGKLDQDTQYVHFLLEFDLDSARVADRLSYAIIAKDRHRLESKTSDVFSPDGEFLYNQDEMAEEYQAALGKGNPKGNRWVLLSVLGVVVVGSVWVLRKRVA